MCCLQKLSLWYADLPLGALPALTGLQELQRLDLDLHHLDQLTTEELTHVLCLLCREISTLEGIEIYTESSAVDVGKCKKAVRAQLEAWGMSNSTKLTITTACEVDDDDMDGSSYAGGGSEQGADGGEGEGSEEEEYYASDRMDEGADEERIDSYLLDEW